jgi:hypothetical protein
MFDWTFVREEVVINDDFVQRRMKPRVGSGSNGILLVVRKLTHAPNYNLKVSFPVVIIADMYDAQGGAIDTSGSRGEDGERGHGGGVRDGMDGEAGEDGRRGTDGQPITVYSRHLVNARLISNGGDGGAGGGGQDGGAIIIGREWDLGGKPDLVLVMPPGAGGHGGSGGDGGNSGAIKVFCVDQGLLQVDSLPGVGGARSAGGAGGAGDQVRTEASPNQAQVIPAGRAGLSGAVGHTGQRITPMFQQSTESDWFAQLLHDMSPGIMQGIAAHWLRLAEYHYRRLGGKTDLNEQQQARLLVDDVLRIDSYNALAAIYREQLRRSQNIYSWERDLDVFPAFEFYEDTVTKYQPLINDLFSWLIGCLRSQSMGLDKQADLQNRKNVLDRLQEAYGDDVANTQVDQQFANLQLAESRQRLNDLKDHIDKRIEELANPPIDFGGLMLAGLMAVAGIVAIVVTYGGATPTVLAAAPGIIALAAGSISGDHNADDVAWNEFGKSMANLPDYSAKLEKNASGLKDALGASDGLAGFFAAAGKLASIRKVLNDLQTAHTDAELQKLYVAYAEAGHAQLLALMRAGQTQLANQAAQARSDAAQMDLQGVQAMLSTSATDTSSLSTQARALVRTAQRYYDMLGRYVFKAARAVEIYSLTDTSHLIRFDFGFIHPDIERDEEEGFITPSELADAYLSAVQTIPVFDLHELDAYDRNLGRQTSGIKLLTFEGALLNSFKNSSSSKPVSAVPDLPHIIGLPFNLKPHPGMPESITRTTDRDQLILFKVKPKPRLVFTIGLGDLPDYHYEVKVATARISLIGATAATPSISCRLMHLGNGQQKRYDTGEVVESYLRPRFDTVAADRKTLTAEATMRGSSDPHAFTNFWGRSLAATWELTLEEQSQEQVDLSGLTRIDIEFGYRMMAK